MTTIMHESMPRWYGLSWDPKAVAIRVRLHRDVPLPKEEWNRIRGKFDTLRQNGKCDFRTFNTDLYAGWFGFDNTLAVVQLPEHIEFVGKILKVRTMSRWLCHLCKGEKLDVSGEICFECDGTGRRYYDRQRYSDALVNSIGALVNPIEYNDEEISFQERQLLTVHLLLSDHYAVVGGMVSRAFHHWAREYPQYTEFPDVAAAMNQAYGRMMGESRARISRFKAEIYSGKRHFSLDMSGSGGIWGGPDDDPDNCHGYEFQSKDLYTSVDQLIFLAGLAALHDRADREIKEQQKTA